MHTVTLTADDGTTHTGYLPTGWHEVPLLPYCQLASATDLPGRITATAALLGLPAAPLLADVDLFAIVAQATPFLFGDELPEATEPVPGFEHLGQQYQYVGGLGKLSAGQLEALYALQQAHGAAPLLAAPAMLAVLYLPANATAEQYREAGAAFATLPLLVGWAALMSFTRSSLGRWTNILTASALHTQATAQVTALERALTSGASGTFSQRARRWGARHWLRNVKKML